MQAKIKSSESTSFSPEDFKDATKVDYILDGKTALDSEEEPIIGNLRFDGNAKPSDVIENYTFYNDSPTNLKTGTLTFQSASATTASDVSQGEVFYNNSPFSSEIGTLVFNGNANISDVEKGKTFYNDDLHRKETGTLAFTANDTVTSDVISGKTFYNIDLRQINTGTLTFTGNAQPSDVESGITFYNTNLFTKRTGTLTLSSQSMSGNAVNSNILEGKTAYTTKLRSATIGSMKNNGAVNKALNSGEIYTIPSGYHNGNGVVKENSPREQTLITSMGASSGQIWSGKTAYVNGELIVGIGNPQNILSASGSGSQGAISMKGAVTIYWTYPVSGFYTGVCILGQFLRYPPYPDPTSDDPATSKYKLYMGPGNRMNSNGLYSIEITNLYANTNYVFNVYPYVLIDGNTYWFGTPTPTKIGPYRTGCYQYCGDCGDCYPDCGDCGLCVGYCQTCG